MKAGAKRTSQKATRAPGTASARPKSLRTAAIPSRSQSEKTIAELARNRVVIEGVTPEIDGGRFAAKSHVGALFEVGADIFADGHEAIDAAFIYRPSGSEAWLESPMSFAGNDRWTASVKFPENRFYDYGFRAWRDLFATWRGDTAKKIAAGQAIGLELEEGRRLVEAAAIHVGKATDEGRALDVILSAFADAPETDAARFGVLYADGVGALMARTAPRANPSQYERLLKVFVDRRLGATGSWYELFPRSQAGDGVRHGTFEDVIGNLSYVRDLGFEVLYFPPIHPIGTTNRKGRNNSLRPEPGDPGSPYAIGSSEGGHDAIHPDLGSFEAFDRLVKAAREHGLEVALDFAIQCSPDHPWIKEHPEWFDWRPDGTIKFAENPPKKYEDIVNVHFYREAIPDLWLALRDIVLFWIGHGITIFRVDNPHTKPFPFWEWLIGEVRARHPETIFLAEAFTRPKVMKRLAKVGFTQSYTYFTWRNAKWEIEQYLTEMTTEESRFYMRPNFFANTPDINPPFLQTGGRPAFQIRLALAATLGGSYGIYNGFEISEAAAVPGREEYFNSEKYQLRAWNMDQPDNLSWDIRLMNKLRAEHAALADFANLTFYTAWNENMIYYGKRTPDNADFLLFHVCLDPHNAQDADFEVPLWEFGLGDDGAVEVEDMVSGNRFIWYGKIQHLRLDPYYRPYAIWRLIGPEGAP